MYPGYIDITGVEFKNFDGTQTANLEGTTFPPMSRVYLPDELRHEERKVFCVNNDRLTIVTPEGKTYIGRDNAKVTTALLKAGYRLGGDCYFSNGEIYTATPSEERWREEDEIKRKRSSFERALHACLQGIDFRSPLCKHSRAVDISTVIGVPVIEPAGSATAGLAVTNATGEISR